MSRTAWVRRGCRGIPPLSGRLEPWQVELCAAPEVLDRLLEAHGSPVNLHHSDAFERNVEAIRSVARAEGIALEILFPRRANKALLYVDHTRRIGAGVDTASEEELAQCLERGFPPERLQSTAAVKSERLVRTCIRASVSLVVDNRDELELVSRIARAEEAAASIVLGLSGFLVDGTRLRSRFGVDMEDVLALGARIAGGDSARRLRLVGLHFHLDGHLATQRIAAVAQCLQLTDALRTQGHPVRSIDIGGGMPVSYLDGGVQWTTFLDELGSALRGERAPVTYRNHGLGLHAAGDRIAGELEVYPCYQRPTAPAWLKAILDASIGPNGDRIGDAIRKRDLTLRCEPGRSLLDGCGLTAARVVHRKRHPDGSWSVGLAMNRTQHSTTRADHPVDPLLVPLEGPERQSGPQMEGYLMGAASSEHDLITRRRLRFPLGVAQGDIVVFPNTAGYLMHSVESRAHLRPLASNVVVTDGIGDARVDEIDSGRR